MYYSDHNRKKNENELKELATEYHKLPEHEQDCAKLETKVRGRKLSRTFQELNNPSFAWETVSCIEK